MRNFPILNDRLLWRMVLVTENSQWHYGKSYERMQEKYRFQVYSSTDLAKGSCDDHLFESKIRCLNGYFICRSAQFEYKNNQLIGSQLMGTSGVKYLPLERIETACPTGLDSPINVSEVQALGLKPGPGFITYES